LQLNRRIGILLPRAFDNESGGLRKSFLILKPIKPSKRREIRVSIGIRCQRAADPYEQLHPQGMISEIRVSIGIRQIKRDADKDLGALQLMANTATLIMEGGAQCVPSIPKEPIPHPSGDVYTRSYR
jgi:hypothetical protein